jgi:hypothetical protein
MYFDSIVSNVCWKARYVCQYPFENNLNVWVKLIMMLRLVAGSVW